MGTGRLLARSMVARVLSAAGALLRVYEPPPAGSGISLAVVVLVDRVRGGADLLVASQWRCWCTGGPGSNVGMANAVGLDSHEPKSRGVYVLGKSIVILLV